MKRKGTIKELAEKLGVSPVNANGFVNTLLKLGKAKHVGVVKKPKGTRGRPTNIYTIDY